MIKILQDFFSSHYIAMIAYVLFMLLKKKHGVDSLRFTHFIA